MRINHKILSIPPYISTSWKNISSLQSTQEGDKHLLLIYLQTGACITVPDLDPLVIQAIFNTHAKHLEMETKAPVEVEIKKKRLPTQENSSIKFFEFDSIQSMLCHNEQERNSPDLPQYILNKVEHLSKEMGLSNSATLPAPEPGCNCPYCQIAKSIQKSSEPQQTSLITEQEEEEVTEKDLSFRSWIIHPIDQDLYRVTNPDDPTEEYQVFLKTPIGCTCGSNHCEHIKAVLHS